MRATMAEGDVEGGTTGDITVKVVTLDKTYVVEIGSDQTIAFFREHIRKIASIPASYRVRLIHAGRMLVEPEKSLTECQVINSSFVHCSAIEDTADKPWAQSTAAGGPCATCTGPFACRWQGDICQGPRITPCALVQHIWPAADNARAGRNICRHAFE